MQYFGNGAVYEDESISLGDVVTCQKTGITGQVESFGKFGRVVILIGKNRRFMCRSSHLRKVSAKQMA